MKKRYLVTISKKHVDLEFKFMFKTIEEAAVFIDNALNAYQPDDDDEDNRDGLSAKVAIVLLKEDK